MFKKMLGATAALMLAFGGVALTAIPAGATGQDTCPDGGGWTKIEPIDALTYTYNAPSGQLITEVCYKAANDVIITDIADAASYEFVSTVENDNEELQEISHVSVKLTDPPDDVCDNIEGTQETVPEGLVKDGDDCVEPDPESGEDVVEQVNCESGEVDITTTPWTEGKDGKVYGDPVVTHEPLDGGEYVECYGEQPDPESGSDVSEECVDELLVTTTVDWTQEWKAEQTGYVLQEKDYADPKVSRVPDAECDLPPALALTGAADNRLWMFGAVGALGLGALIVVAVAVTRRLGVQG
jgi:hypothetical protein